MIKQLIAAGGSGAMLLALLACDPVTTGGDDGGTQQTSAATISDGTVLGPSNYGLWKVKNKKAAPKCKWAVKGAGGRTASSGGVNDMVTSFPGVKGLKLQASGCGMFKKAFGS